MKYHLDSKGDPAPCKATKQQCPLSSEEDHYDTPEEARKAFERKQGSPIEKVLKKVPWKKVTATAMVMVATFNLSGCKTDSINFERPTEEQSKTVTEENETIKDKINKAINDARDKIPEDITKDLPKDITIEDIAKELPDDTDLQTIEDLIKDIESSNDSKGHESRQSKEGNSLEPDKPTDLEVQEAITKLGELEIKGRAPMTGYDRDKKFASGSQWEKAKQDIYNRDFVSIVYDEDGVVQEGTLLSDPYTKKTIIYKRGGGPDVDVEHVVALGNAWATGAQYYENSMSPEEAQELRERLATDPDNLLAVDYSANRQKGDADAATWLPSNKEYRCTYAVKQVSIKTEYYLWTTPAENDALAGILAKC